MLFEQKPIIILLQKNSQRKQHERVRIEDLHLRYLTGVPRNPYGESGKMNQHEGEASDETRYSVREPLSESLLSFESGLELSHGPDIVAGAGVPPLSVEFLLRTRSAVRLDGPNARAAVAGGTQCLVRVRPPKRER